MASGGDKAFERGFVDLPFVEEQPFDGMFHAVVDAVEDQEYSKREPRADNHAALRPNLGQQRFDGIFGEADAHQQHRTDRAVNQGPVHRKAHVEQLVPQDGVGHQHRCEQTGGQRVEHGQRSRSRRACRDAAAAKRREAGNRAKQIDQQRQQDRGIAVARIAGAAPPCDSEDDHAQHENELVKRI